MPKLITSPAWQKLKDLQEVLRHKNLTRLFEADPGRAERYKVSLEGLSFDFSRTHMTDDALDQLVKLAEGQHLSEKRAQMFKGGKINNTEDRAVLHTALRRKDDAPLMVDGVDVMPEIRAVQQKIEAFVSDVREGRWLGATGQKIKTVINIGIGGSDLGPRLAVSALRCAADGPEVRFVSNVDASEIKTALKGLDPAATLFVVVSKTFTTQETLMNAQTSRKWLVATLGEDAVANHFVAVSTNLEKVREFGIADANIFPMWDWVGGRYSLWSAVGLSIALAIGWSNFQKFLGGAAAMDEHFLWTPLHRNIPVLMALTGVWYRNFWGTTALVVLPYDERLRDLPRYFQQLDMESNGKSVATEGYVVPYETGPMIFGECGSVGQHSFHQWLHQGTDMVLMDFIGIEHDDWDEPEHHKVLNANLRAQVEALKTGRRDEAAPYRTNPGNKPAHVVWLERLDPYYLGMLLALYEHKVFVQGAVWDINSFDQFGVELGKKLVKEMAE